MIVRRFGFFFALICASLLSCTETGGANDVSSAEDEFVAQRFASAQKICDRLILGDSFENLSVEDLCRLSILTAQLADVSDEDANMALASRCMQAAMQREPDSVMHFLHSLPADMQSRVLFVRQLTRAVDPALGREESDGEHMFSVDSIPGE